MTPRARAFYAICLIAYLAVLAWWFLRLTGILGDPL